MKKTLGVLVAGLATAVAFAGADNVVVSFSTPGPDTYADGTQVLDGECYALVWTPAGSTFAGINADGTAAGDSKVVLTAPVAKDGKCPNILFQVDETYLADNGMKTGSWGVYVLDTRRFADDGSVASVGKKGIVNSYGATSAATDGKMANAGTMGAVAVKTTSGVPEAGKNLTVQKMEVKDGFVYITVTGALSCMQYALASGDKPGDVAAGKDAPTAYGDAEGKAILVTPVKGGSQFFKVNRK